MHNSIIAPRSLNRSHAFHKALPLGVLVYDNSFEADNLLAIAADDLKTSGYRVGGVVQSNAHRQGRRKCDMYLKDLLSGEEILISSDRGNEARGCRLDLAAFASAGVWGERALAERVDLLVINKFGKEELHGRGLRPLLAEALIANIPVIIGVSRLNLDDFLAFTADAGTLLTPVGDAVVIWCRETIMRRANKRPDEQAETTNEKT